MLYKLQLPCIDQLLMIAGCYGGTTSANVSWQASPLQAIAIADRAQQIEVTDQLRLAHAAQQGKNM